MLNFFGWVGAYLIKALIVVAFMAVGVALGVNLRKMKNKKLEKNQED